MQELKHFTSCQWACRLIGTALVSRLGSDENVRDLILNLTIYYHIILKSPILPYLNQTFRNKDCPTKSHTRAVVISKSVTINNCGELPEDNIKHFPLYNLETSQANNTFNKNDTGREFKSYSNSSTWKPVINTSSSICLSKIWPSNKLTIRLKGNQQIFFKKKKKI